MNESKRSLSCMVDNHESMILSIAHNRFGVNTLEVRQRDSLDFKNVSVCAMKNAINDAFEAGRRSQKYAIAIERGLPTLQITGEGVRTSFGGVTAIRDFVDERGDIPIPIANVLLAMSGGYTGIVAHTFVHEAPIFVAQHSDAGCAISGKTHEEAWSAAAERAVKAHEALEAEMLAANTHRC